MKKQGETPHKLDLQEIEAGEFRRGIVDYFDCLLGTWKILCSQTAADQKRCCLEAAYIGKLIADQWAFLDEESKKELKSMERLKWEIVFEAEISLRKVKLTRHEMRVLREYRILDYRIRFSEAYLELEKGGYRFRSFGGDLAWGYQEGVKKGLKKYQRPVEAWDFGLFSLPTAKVVEKEVLVVREDGGLIITAEDKKSGICSCEVKGRLGCQTRCAKCPCKGKEGFCKALCRCLKCDVCLDQVGEWMVETRKEEIKKSMRRPLEIEFTCSLSNGRKAAQLGSVIPYRCREDIRGVPMVSFLSAAPSDFIVWVGVGELTVSREVLLKRVLKVEKCGSGWIAISGDPKDSWLPKMAVDVRELEAEVGISGREVIWTRNGPLTEDAVAEPEKKEEKDDEIRVEWEEEFSEYPFNLFLDLREKERAASAEFLRIALSLRFKKRTNLGILWREWGGLKTWKMLESIGEGLLEGGFETKQVMSFLTIAHGHERLELDDRGFKDRSSSRELMNLDTCKGCTLMGRYSFGYCSSCACHVAKMNLLSAAQRGTSSVSGCLIEEQKRGNSSAYHSREFFWCGCETCRLIRGKDPRRGKCWCNLCISLPGVETTDVILTREIYGRMLEDKPPGYDSWNEKIPEIRVTPYALFRVGEEERERFRKSRSPKILTDDGDIKEFILEYLRDFPGSELNAIQRAMRESECFSFSKGDINRVLYDNKEFRKSQDDGRTRPRWRLA